MGSKRRRECEGRAAHLYIDAMLRDSLNPPLPHFPRSCESSSFSKPFPPLPLVSAASLSPFSKRAYGRRCTDAICTSTLLSQRPVVAALSQLARFAASLEHLPPLLDGACSLHVPLSRSARRAVPSIAVAPLVAAVLVKVHGGTEFQQQPARNGCRWTAG